MVLSQALPGETVFRQLGLVRGVTAAVTVASSSFGPVAGGSPAQWFGWPSVFLVSLPVGALAMLLALRLRARSGVGGSGSGVVRFDEVGLLLSAGPVAVPLLPARERLQHLDAAALLGRLMKLGASRLCLPPLMGMIGRRVPSRSPPAGRSGGRPPRSRRRRA